MSWYANLLGHRGVSSFPNFWRMFWSKQNDTTLVNCFTTKVGQVKTISKHFITFHKHCFCFHAQVFIYLFNKFPSFSRKKCSLRKCVQIYLIAWAIYFAYLIVSTKNKSRTIDIRTIYLFKKLNVCSKNWI